MAADGIEIRRAMADDVPALTAIARRAYGPYVETIGVRPQPLDADYGAAVRAGAAHVACAEPAEGSGSDVAGLLVLALAPEHVLVENVAVDPTYQHAGIGRALLAFAEDHARAHGRGLVRLYTHRDMSRNRRIYRELGYVAEPAPAGDRTPRVFMVKRLEG